VVLMRGRRLQIEWQEDEETLFRLYKQERDPELRPRLHALWLLRQGHRVRWVARVVGVHERSLQRWLAWYREGGIAEVLKHRRGGRQGREPKLNAEQQARLVEEAAEGTFTTIWDAVRWVEQEFGVTYTYWGMRSLFVRLKLKRKVPRPLAAKASLRVQERWKKGALLLPYGSRG